MAAFPPKTSPGDKAPFDIFLQPGAFYFGNAGVRIRTILGSCVSIMMRHRRGWIGGMCHYMLPQRLHQHGRQLDGRYAEDAVQLFLREIAMAGTRPGDYEVKLAGGARMFDSALDIGGRNIEAARRLLGQHGFNVSAEHLAGTGHRHVVFDVLSGRVWLAHVSDTLLGSRAA